LDNCENAGVGLAAIQIGIPVRVGIIRTPKLKLDLVNAEIISGSEMHPVQEGCLSFPGEFIIVNRMKNILVRNEDGRIYELSEFEAQAIQHEIDHFNGLTMFDRRV